MHHHWLNILSYSIFQCCMHDVEDWLAPAISSVILHSQSHFGNSYYHLNVVCVQAIWPTFEAVAYAFFPATRHKFSMHVISTVIAVYRLITCIILMSIFCYSAIFCHSAIPLFLPAPNKLPGLIGLNEGVSTDW